MTSSHPAESGPLDRAVQSAVERAVSGVSGSIAVALSGGIDSTVVAAALVRAGCPVTAYALDTGRAALEARWVADALGLELELLPLPDGGIRGTSPAEVVAALGQPTHSGAPFGFLPLYRALAARGIEMVLTGDGADEAFAGHAYHRTPPAQWSADIWTTWQAVRALGIDASALLRPTGRPPWETSIAAQRIADEVRGIDGSAARLRWLDVRLRQDAQCVALQRALATACGLQYRAPLADPAVTRRALAAPVRPDRPKQPLVDLAERWLERPWPTTKQPMHTPTGGRPLDAAWLRWLSPEGVARHGVFRAETVARLVATVDPTAAWLRRELVVVATTHAGLESGVFTPDQLRGASSSR